MIARPAQLLDLVHICRNMRPDEIEQTLAFGYATAYDPDQCAATLFTQIGPKVTLVGADGMPAYCGGVMEVGPEVFSGWAVGTMAGWETQWRSITKATRRFHDSLLAGPARRIQLTALASRTAACQWYVKGLKMQPEGIRRAYGRNGEDAIEFSRVRTEA